MQTFGAFQRREKREARKSEKLTRIQRCYLEALTRPGSFEEGHGCTNMTMSALERRGLVKFHWDNVLKSSSGIWKITDAGREFLAQNSK